MPKAEIIKKPVEQIKNSPNFGEFKTILHIHFLNF